MANSDNTDPYAELARLQQQLNEEQQRAADSPSNQPNPPGFDEICRNYALRDSWTVAEAALLLNACRPKRPVPLPGGPSQDDAAIRETQNFLISCLDESLPVSGSIPRLYKSRARIRVADLNALIKRKSLAVPETLSDALAAQFEEGTKRDRPHGNQARSERIHQAACEAALRYAQNQSHKFIDEKGKARRNKLAIHLYTYPDAWVPVDLVNPAEGSPLNEDRLARIISPYLKEHGY